jgi:hypothetical protein
VLICFTNWRSQTVDLAFTNCQRCPIPAKLTGVARLGEPAPAFLLLPFLLFPEVMHYEVAVDCQVHAVFTAAAGAA